MKVSQLDARAAELYARICAGPSDPEVEREYAELSALQTAYIHGAYIGVRPDLSGFGYEFSYREVGTGKERIRGCDKVGYLAGIAEVQKQPVVIEEGLARWRENLVTRLERYGVTVLEED